MASAAWLVHRVAGSWRAEGGESSEDLLFRLSSADSLPNERFGGIERLTSGDSMVSAGSNSAPGVPSSSILEFSLTRPGKQRIFKHFSQERLASHMLRRPFSRLPSDLSGDSSARFLGPTETPVREAMLRAYGHLLYRRNTSSREKQGHLLDFWNAMETVSAFSVFFVRRPVQGALTKRLWRYFFLILAMSGMGMTLAFAYYHYAVWHSYPIYRFTATGNRIDWSAGAKPAAHGLGAFGVANYPCPVHERVVKVEEDGPTMTVHYAHPVSMNAFWIRTANGTNSTPYDPIRFWLEGSNDGEAWTVVGASVYMDMVWGGFGMFDYQFGTTAERNTVQIVGVYEYVRIVNMLQWQLVDFTFIACGVAAIRAMCGNLRSVSVLGTGMLLTFASMCTLGVHTLLSAPGSRLESLTAREQAKHIIKFSFIFLILGGTVLVRQRWIPYAAWLAMAYGVAIQLSQEWVNFERGIIAPTPILCTLVAIFGVFSLALLVRFHILQFSRRVVADDKHQYDVLWESIVATQREQLEALSDLSVRACASSELPRQYYSSAIIAGINAPFERAPSRSDRLASRAKAVPIMDINQIYAQATCVHTLLLSKVQGWAGDSGGMFPAHDGSLVRWESARGSGEERRRVKWGQIKREARAVEKVIRCYGEDVSRLVDVCRQSIVFSSVSELAHCLQLMADDEGVELVRVKNRMSLAEDGAASAGFRNVSVNLRVVEEGARSFGVDTHVCEVQLLLSDFAALQKSEGHKRYVHFRNVRGE